MTASPLSSFLRGVVRVPLGLLSSARPQHQHRVQHAVAYPAVHVLLSHKAVAHSVADVHAPRVRQEGHHVEVGFLPEPLLDDGFKLEDVGQRLFCHARLVAPLGLVRRAPDEREKTAEGVLDLRDEQVDRLRVVAGKVCLDAHLITPRNRTVNAGDSDRKSTIWSAVTEYRSQSRSKALSRKNLECRMYSTTAFNRAPYGSVSTGPIRPTICPSLILAI